MGVSNFPPSRVVPPRLNFSEGQCRGHLATNHPLRSSFQIGHDLFAIRLEVFDLALVFVHSPSNSSCKSFGTDFLGELIHDASPRDFRHHHLFLRISFANPTLHTQGKINVIVSCWHQIIDMVTQLPCATFHKSQQFHAGQVLLVMRNNGHLRRNIHPNLVHHISHLLPSFCSLLWSAWVWLSPLPFAFLCFDLDRRY